MKRNEKKLLSFKKVRAYLKKQSLNHDRDDENLEDTWDKKIKFIDHILDIYNVYLETLLNIDKSGGSFKDLLKEKEAYIDLLVTAPLEKKSNIPINKNIQECTFFNDEEQIKFLKLFLSPNYSPPDDPLELRNHLFAISFWYWGLARIVSVEVPYWVGFRIDFSLVKIVHRITILIFQIDHRGKHIDRTYKSKKEKERKKISNDEIIRNEYIRFLNAKDRNVLKFMSKNGIAKMLKEENGRQESCRKIVSVMEEHHRKFNSTPPWKKINR